MRECLGARTQHLHARLEKALHIAREGAGLFELTEYLGAIRGWIETVDAQVWGRPWPVRLRAAERRGKVAWIDADLARLGSGPANPVVAPPVPVAATPAALLGVAYVLEGSMLGGRVLGRRFAALAGGPLRFFSGYGAETGPLWHALLDEIERSAAAPGALRQITQAASTAFACVESWMIKRRAADPRAA